MTRASRRTRRRPAAVLAALAAGLLLLSACTGIPDSSTPQRIGLVAGGAVAKPSPPPRDAPARTIVSQFLAAGANGDSKHASAREYLTAAASRKWSDQRTVIISSTPQVPDPVNGKITVAATVVGTVNASGVYTVMAGPRTASPFVFSMTQVDRQWRISDLASGVIVTAADFARTYHQQVVYFCAATPDTTCSYLPDLRWTLLSPTDPTPLALWLVQQAVGAVRPELTEVTANDVFPPQATASSVTVRSVDGVLQVEIPGSSQLPVTARNRIAQVIARTLGPVQQSGDIMITDSQRPVHIPATGGATEFTADQFTPPDNGPRPLYFVDKNHHVRVKNNSTNRSGTSDELVKGPLGTDAQFQVTSGAMAQRGSEVAVAATTGGPPPSGSGQFYVGTLATGIHLVKLGGQAAGLLTRPAWAPGGNEVWVGDKGALYRVSVNGTTARATAVATDLPIPAGNLQYSSIRFSPDGNQVALTVRPAGAAPTLYVGAVQRENGTVRVVGTTAISPPGYEVTDADWTSPFALAVVASPPGTDTTREVYTTGIDGSLWSAYSAGTVNLPAEIENIASSTSGDIWIESGNQLFENSPSVWVSGGNSGYEYGHEPVFETS